MSLPPAENLDFSLYDDDDDYNYDTYDDPGSYLGEGMKSFVSGLKDRISSELGMLIALEEEGNKMAAGAGSGNRGGTRSARRGLTQPIMTRKFIPLPLLEGSTVF